MKQGTAVNRIVMLLFALAIALYFGGAAWRGLRTPYSTVQAYSYAVEDTMGATGYLVRTEQVLTGSGGIVRLLPTEGEKIAAGSTVALLYADAATLERSQRLETLQQEVDQLAAAIDAAGESNQGEKIGEKVTDALVSLRSAVATGDFTRLESQVSTFKSAVYQQAQRYGNADDLAAALVAAQGEMAVLREQTSESIGRVTISQSGIFSGQVDGYETVLTPDILESLTPSALDALEDQALPTDSAALGKLVTQSTWYFVCPMTEAEASRLIEDRQVRVRFSRDWSGEVDMTVERIGAPENGRVAVILSSRRSLSDITLLRRQTVDMVFSQQTGIRVPTAAVRVEEGQSVVYVLVGPTAEKKPVNILAQGDDYTIVEPLLPEGSDDKTEKKALRVGDMVIIANEAIWDGKIME